MGCVSRQGQPPAHACLRVASVGPCGMRACGAGVLIPHTWLLIGFWFCCYNCTPGVFRVPYKYARLASVHTWTCSCSERSTTTVEGAPPPEDHSFHSPLFSDSRSLDFSAAQVGNDERVEAMLRETTCIFEICLLLLDIHVAQRVHAYIHKLDTYCRILYVHVCVCAERGRGPTWMDDMQHE